MTLLIMKSFSFWWVHKWFTSSQNTLISTIPPQGTLNLLHSQLSFFLKRWWIIHCDSLVSLYSLNQTKSLLNSCIFCGDTQQGFTFDLPVLFKRCAGAFFVIFYINGYENRQEVERMGKTGFQVLLEKVSREKKQPTFQTLYSPSLLWCSCMTLPAI